jgi:hypothetical protein
MKLYPYYSKVPAWAKSISEALLSASGSRRTTMWYDGLYFSLYAVGHGGKILAQTAQIRRIAMSTGDLALCSPHREQITSVRVQVSRYQLGDKIRSLSIRVPFRYACERYAVVVEQSEGLRVAIAKIAAGALR